MPDPMNRRDALYGGRTSAIRLLYTAGENEKVSYADVVSLYPYVMCDPQCYYPLGHPEIMHNGFENHQTILVSLGLTCTPLVACSSPSCLLEPAKVNFAD